MNKEQKLRSYSLIHLALERKFPLPAYQYLEGAQLELEYGGFLSPVANCHLSEALNLNPQSLSLSWKENYKYIKKAMEISNNDEGNWIDREEVYMIKEAIGEPPLPCCPIYVITIKKEEKEKIVYIGKTSSETSRFAGGHRVAVELHKPIYNDYEKIIYQCLVILSDKDKNYLPLEWISPLNKAKEMLDSVESQLIYEFKPELNVQKKVKYCAKYPFQIHIQDADKLSLVFGKDYFVDPI